MEMRHYIQKIFNKFGFQVTRFPPRRPADAAASILETANFVQPYTATSFERIEALCLSVEYIIKKGISGAFVECGVWKGGSSMAIALTLKKMGVADRSLYLFDTFSGMVPATKRDKTYDGQTLVGLERTPDYICMAQEDEVRRNMELVDSGNTIHFVKGRVEETLPEFAPKEIALLRLDTDWYESTRWELEQLFPRLQSGGILIIDDYGTFRGCKEAVDEYFASLGSNYYFHRIDYTGRLIIK